MLDTFLQDYEILLAMFRLLKPE